MDVSAEEERLLDTFLASTFDTFAPLEGFQKSCHVWICDELASTSSSLTTGRT